MPRNRDKDFDHTPRPRRRSRRARRGGPGAGMWVAIIGVLVVCVVGVVAVLVISRRGGGEGRAGGLFAGGVSGHTITAAEFKSITKNDTIAALEARFGRADRLSFAELERIKFRTTDRRYPQMKADRGFGSTLQAQYGVANPEVYYWRGTDTDVYVVVANGIPNQNLHLKFFFRQTTDENGHFHGETIIDNFGDGRDP